MAVLPVGQGAPVQRDGLGQLPARPVGGREIIAGAEGVRVPGPADPLVLAECPGEHGWPLRRVLACAQQRASEIPAGGDRPGVIGASMRVRSAATRSYQVTASVTCPAAR